VWQGAYVFSLDTETGFELKGRISHVEADSLFLKSGSYYPGSEFSVKRSLYMDDVLYTISDGRVKMNSLDDLREINSLDLPVQRDVYYGYLE
ncbi:MAG: beta-propeller domain-containing protein, partial [Candidatus Hydrothermarchaeales archaeon]